MTCADCDDQGFRFVQKDGAAFMEGCPTCAAVTNRGSGFRGLWLDLNWSPNEESPPGTKAWKVRLVEESDGKVRLMPLSPEQLRQLCGSTKAGLHWLTVIAATSELANLQQEVVALQERVRALERGGLLARLFQWIFGK